MRQRWLFLLLLAPLFWAGNALLARAMVGEVPPVALSFWRWAIALALLAPFTAAGVRTAWPEFRRNWLAVAVMGLLAVGAYNTLLYLAVQTTTAINATLVGAAMPPTMLVLGRLWLKEPVRPLQMVGIAVSLVGLVVVVSHGEPERLRDLSLNRGDLLMLLATLAWAVYSVMLKRYPMQAGGLVLLTVLIAVGVAAILPLYLWELGTGARMADGWRPPAAILYTAIFPSLASTYLWNRGIQVLGSAMAGQYSYALPAFTAILSVLLLGEPFQWHHGLGGALIFVGIALATRLGKR